MTYGAIGQADRKCAKKEREKERERKERKREKERGRMYVRWKSATGKV